MNATSFAARLGFTSLPQTPAAPAQVAHGVEAATTAASKYAGPSALEGVVDGYLENARNPIQLLVGIPVALVGEAVSKVESMIRPHGAMLGEISDAEAHQLTQATVGRLTGLDRLIVLDILLGGTGDGNVRHGSMGGNPEALTSKTIDEKSQQRLAPFRAEIAALPADQQRTLHALSTAVLKAVTSAQDSRPLDETKYAVARLADFKLRGGDASLVEPIASYAMEVFTAMRETASANARSAKLYETT